MENRTLSYGIAGSLAVHLLLFLLLAMWMQFPVLREVVRPPPETEKEVTLLFAQNIEEAPAPPPEPPKPIKAPERYVRTTQNAEAPAPPKKTDLVSDRNTVASAKLAPDPKGDAAMPTTDGVNVPTMELANRDHKDVKLKNDSAPSPPPMKQPRPKIY